MPQIPSKVNSPTLRLAAGVGPPDAFAKGMAHVGSNDELPALLVSYYYLPLFEANRSRYTFRNWVMDSGAFSAHNSGATINLNDYIDCCKRLMSSDSQLVEIYALDVIGDWKASLDNTEKMWAAGVPAIPCFHVGEPWDALISMAKRYPKIAFGGVAQIGSKKALAWAGQCFARVWPKKVHGFALCSEAAVMSLPFHSVDSTSWELGPCITGDTLVSTNNGLVPIAELARNPDAVHTINTFQGVAVAGCQAVYSGHREVLSLQLKTGQKLRCTLDHKLLTEDGWKKAGQLLVGDHIIVPSKQVRTPVVKECLTDEMLGWMLGDGCYNEISNYPARADGSTREYLIILFVEGADDEARHKLIPAWDAFVEKDYPLSIDKTDAGGKICETRILKKICEVRAITDKMRALGFTPSKAVAKQLPTYILTARPEQQLAFLRGLFSADGTVKHKGGLSKSVQRLAGGCQIGLASNSPKLLDQVQILLMEFGIHSHQSWSHPPKKINPQGQLMIAGLSALKYMRLIGFNLTEKALKFRSGQYARKQKRSFPVVKIELAGTEDVYDILMPAHHHFIANGMVVHNCKFGNWRAFGGQRVSVRGSTQNLRAEVEWYLEMERKARVRWKKEMASLEALSPSTPLAAAPTVRLAGKFNPGCHSPTGDPITSIKDS